MQTGLPDRLVRFSRSGLAADQHRQTKPKNHGHLPLPAAVRYISAKGGKNQRAKIKGKVSRWAGSKRNKTCRNKKPQPKKLPPRPMKHWNSSPWSGKFLKIPSRASARRSNYLRKKMSITRR